MAGCFYDNNFFFLAFSDNLLAQNHSYKLFISVFAFWNKMSTSECDKYRDVSSAKESKFPVVALGISLT